MSSGDFAWARLTPELLVTNLEASLRFWRDLCGFRVVYDRFAEGFAYLDLDGAQVMLEQLGRGRNWIVGAMDAPFGRGINFQIGVRSIDPVLASLAARDWPLFMEPEEKTYLTVDGNIVVRQFLVQDPDGYLLRFSARRERRAEL